MDATRYCDDAPCPSHAAEQQVEMHCPAFTPRDGEALLCSWPSGHTAEASYDRESGTVSYQVPEGVNGSAQVPLLRSAGGETLCGSDAKCSLRKRCASKTDGAGSAINGKDVKPPTAPVLSNSPAATAVSVFKQLSWADRLLTVWIIGAMILGVILGKFTNISDKLDTTKVDTVSLPIALGLWGMMWPVLTKVRYEVLGELLREGGMMKQVSLSLVMNWIVGPALMTGLAWATLPDLEGYRNGIILVGLARCIAMVLLWNQLARGHADYCAVLVAVNSIMQIVLYAPLALFYIKVVSRSGGSIGFSFWDVAKSVLIFLGAPLVAGIVLRYSIIAAKGRTWLDTRFMPWFGPLALVSLVYTVLVLFALQAKNVLDNIGDVCRVSVPMLLYFSIMWTATLLVTRKLHGTYEQAVTQSFTAASNNFELAIAIAVGTFGVNSQEALAATIGPLIEVPVLLALVYVALWLHQKWTWFKPPSMACGGKPDVSIANGGNVDGK